MNLSKFRFIPAFLLLGVIQAPAQETDSLLMELNLAYLDAVELRSDPHEIIPILEKMLMLDATRHNHWFNLGMENIRIHNYREAIYAFNRGLVNYPTEIHPALVRIYVNLSFCHNKLEQFQKEKELLLHASKLFPDNSSLLGRQVINAHSRIRYHEADRYLVELNLLLRQEGLNEAEIAFHLGKLYMTTDYLVAEGYLRTAYRYMPDNPEVKGALAWVLIQNSLRINEGMELMQEALLREPKNPTFNHKIGYGYFRKGDLETALDKLYYARELYSEYNFELDEHIGMVKDAMAALEE